MTSKWAENSPFLNIKEHSATFSLCPEPHHVLLTLIGHLQEDRPSAFVGSRICQSAALLNAGGHARERVRSVHPSRVSSLRFACASLEFAASRTS